MAKVLMVKDLRGYLQPFEDDAKQFMGSFASGEVLSVEIKKPRNGALNAKFHVMLQIILENQEYYKNMDQIKDACKIAIGYCETFQIKISDDLTIEYPKPKSISFAAMDEIEFREFYTKAVDWVLQQVIPGMERKGLDDAVKETLMQFAGD